MFFWGGDIIMSLSPNTCCGLLILPLQCFETDIFPLVKKARQDRSGTFKHLITFRQKYTQQKNDCKKHKIIFGAQPD